MATLPPELFRRMDESPDSDFYVLPRLVTHIDDATIAALTVVYRERLPPGGAVLDLMSSGPSSASGRSATDVKGASLRICSTW